MPTARCHGQRWGLELSGWRDGRPRAPGTTRGGARRLGVSTRGVDRRGTRRWRRVHVRRVPRADTRHRGEHREHDCRGSQPRPFAAAAGGGQPHRREAVRRRGLRLLGDQRAEPERPRLLARDRVAGHEQVVQAEAAVEHVRDAVEPQRLAHSDRSVHERERERCEQPPRMAIATERHHEDLREDAQPERGDHMPARDHQRPPAPHARCPRREAAAQGRLRRSRGVRARRERPHRDRLTDVRPQPAPGCHQLRVGCRPTRMIST